VSRGQSNEEYVEESVAKNDLEPLAVIMEEDSLISENSSPSPHAPVETGEPPEHGEAPWDTDFMGFGFDLFGEDGQNGSEGFGSSEEEDVLGILFNTSSDSVATPVDSAAEEIDDLFGNLFEPSDGTTTWTSTAPSYVGKSKKKKAKAPAQPKAAKPKPPKPTLETTHFCDTLSDSVIAEFKKAVAAQDDPIKAVDSTSCSSSSSELVPAEDEYQKHLLAIGENHENEGVFAAMSGLKELHYYHAHPPEAEQMNHTAKSQRALMKELTNVLEPSLTVDSRGGSMFVRFDDENPQYLRALLTGMEGSPYEDGLFMFDVYIPSEYPTVPCLVTHVTPNANTITAPNGPGGFSPNMHASSGKVCLSLLGTWSGQGWEPGVSNLYQVLSSISLMILGAEHPYYMEPGHGGWEDTANINTDLNRVCVLIYTDDVREHLARLCMKAPLSSPPVGFKRVVEAHFQCREFQVLQRLEQWLCDFCSCQECERYHASIISSFRHAECKEIVVHKTNYSSRTTSSIYDLLRATTDEMYDVFAEITTAERWSANIQRQIIHLKTTREQLVRIDCELDSCEQVAVGVNEKENSLKLAQLGGKKLIQCLENNLQRLKSRVGKLVPKSEN
jgi:ubiquitin-protein ligase